MIKYLVFTGNSQDPDEPVLEFSVGESHVSVTQTLLVKHYDVISTLKVK